MVSHPKDRYLHSHLFENIKCILKLVETFVYLFVTDPVQQS